MKHILIVGLGSIAKKHIEAIRKIDQASTIYALRHSNTESSYLDVISIYDFNEIPDSIDFSIICNPTVEHLLTIRKLASLNKPMFIEKPIVHTLQGIDELVSQIEKSNILTYCACNFRFHPAIKFLQDVFKDKKPIEFNVYCGSYLPDWRPGRDYREVYSAKAAMGGGVHLDLIHEIDYTYYLLGKPLGQQSYQRKKSQLEIDSMDIAHYLFEYEHTTAILTMNYYRKETKRQIDIVWDDEVWVVDLLENKISSTNNEIIYSGQYEVMDTYHEQMKYFIRCLEQKEFPMNDINESVEVLKLCLNG